MNALWQRYALWFESLAHREKLIIALALVGGVLVLGGGQWAAPMFAEASKLGRQAAQDRDTAQGILAQLSVLEQQAGSPDAALRSEVERLKQTFAEQEPQIRDVQKSLVPANGMAVFLEGLLKGSRSLQLVSLETIQPMQVASRADEAKSENKPAGTRVLNLYKHGVRIRLAGSYRDLLAYLSDLEQAPQKVLWGPMNLDATSYPKVELTLTVYTLSLDKTWMTL